MNDKKTVIEDYKRHYVYDAPRGHEIVIVHGEEGKEKLWRINCKWKDRVRYKDGRVNDVKIKNYA